MSESLTENPRSPEPLRRRADERTASELFRISAPHQRALLRILAVSDLHGIDPKPLISGFADELPESYGELARRLVEELSDGVELVDALEDIPRLLPDSCVLALRLARQDGTLPGLNSALMHRYPGDQDDANPDESPVTVVARLMIRIFFITLILGFIMLKIMPEFQKMFEEFGVELPAVMKLLMRFCEMTANLWFLMPLALLVLFPFCIPTIRDYLNRWNRLTWRQPAMTRSGNLKRELALIVQARQSATAGIAMFAGTRPVRGMMKRFSKVHEKIENHQDVWGALAEERVISSRDAKALSLSGDGDTQAWLLRWSATRQQHRSETSFTVLFRLVLAAVHVLLGLIVVFVCVAVFMTLTSIMRSIQ